MTTPQLTELQLAIMRVLWKKDGATVNEVHASLQSERELAHATVATLLNRLASAGVLSRKREGRRFVYRTLVSQAQVQRSTLKRVLGHLFGGDPASLVAHLLKARDLEDDDLARVRAEVEAAQARLEEEE